MRFQDYVDGIIKEDGASYYEKEIEMVYPSDEFGIKIQLSSNKGKTRWLDLNNESIMALSKLIEKIKGEV